MESPSDHVRVHLKINGRVQGVYFRASTVAKAQHLSLAGWVMNCPDGSVATVAEGIREKIEEFVAWCHHGPSGAKVTNVEVRWEIATHEFTSFGIRR
jgi:acylphosphatase